VVIAPTIEPKITLASLGKFGDVSDSPKLKITVNIPLLHITRHMQTEMQMQSAPFLALPDIEV
jgi:hypothetical protein